ncbi:hypothetical protein BC7_00026 [Bacillus phage BC-7]|nr:hypothetical protein BC7_00026 [Bacillus phage BC-7]
MTVTKGYVTDEDIDPVYLKSVVDAIVPLMQGITGKVETLDNIIVESTVTKVLIYINGLILPKALYLTVAEMSARQVAEYAKGLDTSEDTGFVKKVARGGFSQEFEKSGGAVPRGTQIMQDYVKYLNRFRKMRTI